MMMIFFLKRSEVDRKLGTIIRIIALTITDHVRNENHSVNNTWKVDACWVGRYVQLPPSLDEDASPKV